ncbi:MAG TPA: DUF1572 family protein [Bacteroidia bacterium]|nr:DUF1572 family protein [Bacteroidia bacterium]
MGQLTGFKQSLVNGIEKLSGELKQFHKEEEIWKVTGDISNSAGNLSLHLIGNLNHFIGAQLGKTAYVRDRDNEFVSRNVHRDVLLRMLDETKSMLEKVLGEMREEDLSEIYPLSTFGEGKTTGFVLITLFGHFNYHLGQINYLRRFFSPTAL